MDEQAPNSAEPTASSDPREAPRPRHALPRLGGRRRRVLWVLGLEAPRDVSELTRAAR